MIQRNKTLKQWGPASVTLFCLIGVVIWVRFTSIQYSYGHPDEIITMAVSANILNTPTVDTNWKLAPLPESFKYPQYNFSGYNLLSAGIRSIFGNATIAEGQSDLRLLRNASVLFSLCTICLTYMLAKQWFTPRVGIAAALIVAASPLLYQDSLYARPETFFTACLLLALLLLGWKVSRPRLAVFASCLLFGLLVSTKISAILLLPLIPLAMLHADCREILSSTHGTNFDKPLQERLRRLIAMIPICLLGIVCGYVLGAPMAFANLADYFYGIQALSSQYTTGHWPHGVADASFIERLGYGLRWLVGTHGLAFAVFFIAGILALAKRTSLCLFFLVLAAAMILLRFCSYPVFFERNLSHLFPILAIVCAVGITSVVSLVSSNLHIQGGLIALLIAAAVWRPLQVSSLIFFEELPGRQSSRVAAARDLYKAEYGVAPLQLGWVNSIEQIRAAVSRTEGKVLLEFLDPGDKYTAKVLGQLKDKDQMQEVGYVSSVFEGIPPSTLHTYFTPTVRFLYCANQGGEEK